MPDRNPYLILGVDFGTSRDAARRRFAHAVKRLRRSGGGPYTVEDMTWALHQVEALEAELVSGVSLFRVPANTAVFAVEGAGVFAPPPERLARRTEPTTDDVIHGLRIDAAREARDALLAEVAAVIEPVPAYSFPEADA